MSLLFRALRGLAGLVPVMSLVLTAFLVTFGADEPAVAHASPTCQLEMSATVANPDDSNCDLSGSHANCSLHSGCLTFTLPMTQGIVTLRRSQHWSLPGADYEPGRTPLLNTPPPIPAA
jgi:hypothetical protein